jgi:hypothetical protein
MEGKGPVRCKGCRFGRWRGGIIINGFTDKSLHVCTPPAEQGWGHVEGAYWVTQTPSVLNKDGWCSHFAPQLPAWRRLAQWVRSTVAILKDLVGENRK